MGAPLSKPPGRAKKPRALRILEGEGDGKDSGGRPIPPAPAFRRESPEPPPVVKEDPLAMEEWERVVPGLERLDLLKPEDRPAIASYCLAWSDQVRSIAMWNAERSPRTWKIRTEADRNLHRWVKELGLSPSSESIWEKPVEDEPDDNPFG